MDEVIERREELLEKIVDVLLAKGISGLSLRPLAVEVGSSARLLIYHFGSKADLLAMALDRVRTRIATAVTKLETKQSGDSIGEYLGMFWGWALEETNQRYFKLLFEIDGLQMHNSDVVPAKSQGSGTMRWVKIFEQRLALYSIAPYARTGAATLVLAAIAGLLQDYFSTGDLARTTAGMNFLILALEAQVTGSRVGTKKEGF